MKLSITAGSTSKSLTIFVLDSTSGSGVGLTGLVYNSSGLSAYYTHSGDVTTATSITLATLATVTTAWSSGGFKEVDATNMPGVYRIDLPDAVLASGKGPSAVVMLKGAANMVPVLIEIELVTGSGSGTVDANVISIDGALTSGNNATLKLKKLDIQNSTVGDDAVYLKSYINGKALNIDGSAAGANGLVISGYGIGMQITGNYGPAVNLTNTNPGVSAVNISAEGSGAPIIAIYALADGPTSDPHGIEVRKYQAGAGSDIKASIDGSLSGSVGSVITLRPAKNMEYANFMFPMYDTETKIPKTGLTVTAQRSIDGSPFAACTNSAVDISDGIYRLTLSAADLNGDKIMLKFTAPTADMQLVEIFTQG